MLTLGVVYSSRQENEHRVPIDVRHLDLIPRTVRDSIRFETGYGKSFGVSDDQLGERFGGVVDREELLSNSDVVLLPKPRPEDLLQFREGGVLWGWPHCVQQTEMTQVAIDRKLTLIAWEAMFNWSKTGAREMHLFERNNEMAGYCSVIHALGLSGMDGSYGPPIKACVISHGSVSRGAVHALQGRGCHDICVYTQRPPWAVHDKIVGCRYEQIADGEPHQGMNVIEGGGRRPLVDALAECDVIVNGILQDTGNPVMILRDGDEHRLKHASLIVDVSCDLGMGFAFARPTTFEQPTFEVGTTTYYGVDHSPSYLWKSASWEISKVVVAFVETVTGGPESWSRSDTIDRAIEIRDGVIRNSEILHFQHRSPDYPHAMAGTP